MLPIIPIAIGVAIGKILKDDSKPQETRVITQYVHDTNNYHYTQNNYSYNVNVRNNSYKKKKTYHISHHSHTKKKYLLPNRTGVQQLPYNNNRLHLSKAALDNRSNQLNPNNRLYQGSKRNRWWRLNQKVQDLK